MNIFKAMVLSLPIFLAACGGGGGSSGETTEQYSISLRADRSSLPVNTAHEPAGQGVYSPYTTTLYVSAKRGSQAIPGGKEVFSCNMAGGLQSASLYYLDGDKEHEDDNGNPLAYRSIVLPSNAGGASFHVHAWNEAGVVTVTCAVTDPRDKREYTTSTQIMIGGASTNTPASVVTKSVSPGEACWLGPRDTTNPRLRNNIQMNVSVMNDNNQPVGSNGKTNVQVSIRNSPPASTGARLMAGGKNGTSLQIATSSSGIAQYSLSSGPSTGVILLEVIADRTDNDVSNGIQDPIVHMAAIPVVNDCATEPLAVDSGQMDNVKIQNGQAFSTALSASGGVAPYTWVAVAGLPNGLTLTSTGVLQGTPRVTVPGEFFLTVRVTDENGATVTQRLKLTIEGNLPDTPVSFDIVGCSGGVTTVCKLPAGVVGSPYSYTFSASGGGTIKWTFTGLPAWLESSDAGAVGMIFTSENLACPAAGGGGTAGTPGTYQFAVTAANNTNSVTRQVSITVDPPAGGCP